MPVISGGGPAVQVATTNLSTSQILALNATPVTLIAAPGAGLAIIPLSTFGSLTFVTAQYASAGSVRLKYGAVAAQTLTNVTAATLAAASQVGWDDNAGLTGTAVASIANVALSVDASAAITTGAGSLRVTVSYYVVST